MVVYKVLEQLNVYFVKESCLMNVLSKFVGPKKIVCFRVEINGKGRTFLVHLLYHISTVFIFLYIAKYFIFHE